jgi:hypothetical protein
LTTHRLLTSAITFVPKERSYPSLTMFPITCNAFGDIVSMINIVTSIIKALDETRGSMAEYRVFKEELIVLQNTLASIDRVAERSSDEVLRSHTLNEVNACCTIVHGAMLRMAKFDILVQKNEDIQTFSARIVKQWRKIKWIKAKKGVVAEYKDKIEARRRALDTLLITLNQ